MCAGCVCTNGQALSVSAHARAVTKVYSPAQMDKPSGASKYRLGLEQVSYYNSPQSLHTLEQLLRCYDMKIRDLIY